MPNPMVEIEKEFDLYKKEKITLESDGYIGIPVSLTVYYDDKTFGVAKYGYNATKLILYVVNTPTERVGVDSDVVIIKSMLDRGFIVAVLDYLGNDKAISPKLDFSMQNIHLKLRKGEYFTHQSLPCELYQDSYIVPAGHNILCDLVYWNLAHHGVIGSLQKIVETWNNDFASVKGEEMVYWLDGKGKQKQTKNSAVWYNKAGEEVPSSSFDACFTKVKYTVAKDISDCVNPDGSAPTLDLKMTVIYPTSNEKSEYKAPVMALSNAHGYITGSSSGQAVVDVEMSRPHFFGFLFDGYAGAIYDYMWVPMARDNSFGYFDGKTNPKSRSGDQLTYSVQWYNDKRINTAALRFIRYLSKSRTDLSFKEDSIGVFGYSKAGWSTAIGLKSLNTYTDRSQFETEADYITALDEKITSIVPKRVFPHRYNESGKKSELQPWLTFNGEEILSGANVIYPGCGAADDDIEPNHAPMFIPLNVTDLYNSAYGASNSFANLYRYHDIPCLILKLDLGHTLAVGNDIEYGVDSYMAFRHFSNYYLKNDAVRVVYSAFSQNKITVKFTGPVSADEIKKVMLASGDKKIAGKWVSLYGNTEWMLFPDEVLNEEKYTLFVPESLKGSNGKAMKVAYTKEFINTYKTSSSYLGREKGKIAKKIYSHSFDTLGDTKICPNTEYNLTKAPDFTPALAISVLTNKGTFLDNEFYLNTTQVFENNAIIKKGNISQDDYGRHFRIDVSVYDTVSRHVQLILNGCTNVEKQTVDLDRPYANFTTKKDAWKTLSINYTSYEKDYGIDGLTEKTLIMKLSPKTDKYGNEIPVYIKDITVTEFI